MDERAARPVERKYVLTRLRARDYLLPSNDGRTIWRLLTYEDGPGHGLEVDWPRDRTFWGVWQWTGPVECVDPDDWERWEAYDLGMYETRRDAIQAALRA